MSLSLETDMLPCTPLEQGDRIAVIGSGIAGQVMAFKLAESGYHPVVLEAGTSPGQGASGNAISLLHPRLSLESSHFHRFMVSAFLHACDFYDRLPPQIWQSRGLLQCATKTCDVKRFKCLAQTPDLDHKHICFLSPDEASQKAGLPLPYACLYYPQSGSLIPKHIRDYLLDKIEILCDSPVMNIRKKEESWEILGKNKTVLTTAKAVILCQGIDVKAFDPGLLWPLFPVKGQLATLKTKESTKNLQCPLAFQHYITPAFGGLHILGASFEKGETGLEVTSKAEHTLLSSVQNALPPFQDSSLCETSPIRRTGIRACLPDFLPLAGPIISPQLFYKMVQKPIKGPWRWPDLMTPHHLYSLAGLGSHGFLTAPWLADRIVENIKGGHRNRQDNTAKITHPARFLMKAIKQGKTIFQPRSQPPLSK